ncbi:MAG: hypothetical protein ACI9MR_003748 [Myxococcota bacterium]|jgi:hypothetical protein
MKVLVSILAVVQLGIVGCSHPHVALEAPGAESPLQMRVAAYETLRPEKRTTRVYQRDGQTERVIDYLTLSDGRDIYHLTDLRPVVNPESDTVAALAQMDSIRSDLETLNYGFGGGGAAATAVVLVGVGEGDSTTMWVGAGIGLVTALVGWIMVQGPTEALSEQRDKVYDSYDADLRARLALPDTLFKAEYKDLNDTGNQDTPVQPKSRYKDLSRDPEPNAPSTQGEEGRLPE